MYRLVKEDYKVDQADVHYASTVDMIALSLLLKDGPSKEIEALLEHSKTVYLAIAQQPQHHASYLTLVSTATPGAAGGAAAVPTEKANATLKRLLIRLGSRNAMNMAGECAAVPCNGAPRCEGMFTDEARVGVCALQTCSTC